jgi:diaminohydroxyphosphoribosylaminopyrimidine deaminase/5-amino-6-(5-phosphoribosylamino)uracil reductase
MPSPFSDKDKHYMRRALGLALRAKGTTFPNPAVGAIVVNKDKIVGTGKTAPAGGDHAENEALRKAGAKAWGATLYVTLEPCCHFGRTAPCTDAIIYSGVKRVVAAAIDPNPLVNGKGLRHLIKAGISVETGLFADRAFRLNEDFFWSIVHKSPWVTLKLATTLDGKIADIHGNSKWISSKTARKFVHELRRRHAAVVVGGRTLRADNPRLTVRAVPGKSPVRVVFSRHKRFSPDLFFVKSAREIRSIVVRPGGRYGAKETDAHGVEFWCTGKTGLAEVIKAFLSLVYKEGLTSVLVEGGREIASAFLELRLVNRLYVFYGNRLIGNGRSVLEFNRGLVIERSKKLDTMEFRRFNDTFMVTGLLDRD